MSILECSSHNDVTTKTAVDPQSRTVNEKLPSAQHDVSLQVDDSIVYADANNLRDINNTQAETRSLPPEILSAIFEFACPPIDFNDRFTNWLPGFDTFCAQDTFHFTLAAVCQYWREIVLSTPQLWTSITLRPNKPGCSIKNATSLLSLYFERARALPISIELDFHGEEVQWYAYQDEPVRVEKEYLARLEPLRKAIFVDGASKIQHLSLIQVPTNWLPFVDENLSQCTSFALFDPMELIEGGDDKNEDKGEGSENDGAFNGGEIGGGVSGEDGEESDEWTDEESDEESSDDSDEDSDEVELAHFHEDNNNPPLLDLTKLPLLKHINLASVPDLRRISFPKGTKIRIRKFVVHNPLLDALVGITMLSRFFDSFLSLTNDVDN